MVLEAEMYITCCFNITERNQLCLLKLLVLPPAECCLWELQFACPPSKLLNESHASFVLSYLLSSNCMPEIQHNLMIYGITLFNCDDIQSNVHNKTYSVSFEIQFMGNSSQDQKDDETDILYFYILYLRKRQHIPNVSLYRSVMNPVGFN